MSRAVLLVIVSVLAVLLLVDVAAAEVIGRDSLNNTIDIAGSEQLYFNGSLAPTEAYQLQLYINDGNSSSGNDPSNALEVESFYFTSTSYGGATLTYQAYSSSWEGGSGGLQGDWTGNDTANFQPGVYTYNFSIPAGQQLQLGVTYSIAPNPILPLIEEISLGINVLNTATPSLPPPSASSSSSSSPSGASSSSTTAGSSSSGSGSLSSSQVSSSSSSSYYHYSSSASSTSAYSSLSSSSSSACSLDCGDFGTCGSDGACHCFGGYTGPLCQLPPGSSSSSSAAPSSPSAAASSSSASPPSSSSALSPPLLSSSASASSTALPPPPVVLSSSSATPSSVIISSSSSSAVNVRVSSSSRSAVAAFTPAVVLALAAVAFMTLLAA